MTSFFSYSPSSIKLGLFHSLFSFISFSAPLILCAYVLWKYGRKYGLRAYLALTLGQTCFLLFLFYGPYFLTYQWYIFEPYLSMLGAALIYNMLYYMDKDKRFDKFPPYYYCFFFGIMFLNPIRLGTFTPLSPISMIVLNQAPTFLYSLFFSINFFILNFSLGLILVHYLDNSIFLLLNANKIKKIFYNLLLISVVYIFCKFPLYIYFQYPFTTLGFPVIAPPLNDSNYGPVYIANIPITIMRNPVFEKPYSFIKKIYDIYMGWGVEFISDNIVDSEEEPNRNVYFKYEAFIRDKKEEIDTDMEDLEDELSKKKGAVNAGTSRIKEKMRNRLKWTKADADYMYRRFELCDELLMDDMWIAKRLQFRTPKYLNLTKVKNCYDENEELLHEDANFKGQDMTPEWFENEDSREPVLWLRFLEPRDLTYSFLSLFDSLPVNFLLNFLELNVNSDIDAKIREFYNLYPMFGIFEFLGVYQDLYENFISQIKSFIQDEILLEKKIERDNLTEEELEALTLLSEVILENEFLTPLAELNRNQKFEFQKAEDLDEVEDEWDFFEEQTPDTDITYEEELLEDVLENNLYSSTMSENENINLTTFEKLLSTYANRLTVENLQDLCSSYYKDLIETWDETTSIFSTIIDGLSFHSLYKELVTIEDRIITEEDLLADPSLLLKEKPVRLYRERVEEDDVIKGIKLYKKGYLLSTYKVIVEYTEKKK